MTNWVAEVFPQHTRFGRAWTPSLNHLSHHHHPPSVFIAAVLRLNIPSPLFFFFFCWGLVYISRKQATSCMSSHPLRAHTHIRALRLWGSPVYGEPQEKQSTPILTDQRRSRTHAQTRDPRGVPNVQRTMHVNERTWTCNSADWRMGQIKAAYILTNETEQKAMGFYNSFTDMRVRVKSKAFKSISVNITL